MVLNNVLHVTSIRVNLVSLARLIKVKINVSFKSANLLRQRMMCLQNRILLKKVNKTPNELWKGFESKIDSKTSNIMILGCDKFRILVNNYKCHAAM